MTAKTKIKEVEQVAEITALNRPKTIGFRIVGWHIRHKKFERHEFKIGKKHPNIIRCEIAATKKLEEMAQCLRYARLKIEAIKG